MHSCRPSSLVDILRWRALHEPDRLAYRFLVDGEFQEIFITYHELDRQARVNAAMLQSSISSGERVLLLFQPGLQFISAFFGCLYAGVIAVPVCPPHPAAPEKNLSGVLEIIADATPAAALLEDSLFASIMKNAAAKNGFKSLKLLVVNNSAITGDEGLREISIRKEDLAFLQYTSGSTSKPRGVKISHGSLLYNLELIENNFGQSPTSHAVIWLPPYHDMGLVGGLLQPLYSGYPVTFMSHLHFLQRPFRWLQAISHFKATTSGGPNFAYELCLRKIKSPDREALDLQSWTVAFNGAEPVNHKTLEKFADFFASCGFRREAFISCYGLAESTLLVTSGSKRECPKLISAIATALEDNLLVLSSPGTSDTRTLVSCGTISSDEQEIRIVDPKTNLECSAGEIGEILISGPALSSGYWNKPEETAVIFGARLPNSNDRNFLRSGDLGFIKDGELYITGRIKELIIADGKNHYPQDIEDTAENSHVGILADGCAAFSLNADGSERVALIAEVNQTFFLQEDEVKAAIRQAISAAHGLRVNDILITKVGGIPRTTSGKKKRFLCRKRFLENTFSQIVAR